MDALQAEIARKRKEREEAKSAAGDGGNKRKWVKRGELEQQRAAEYLRKEAAAKEERERKSVVPQHRYAAPVGAGETAGASATGYGRERPAEDATPTDAAGSGGAAGGSVNDDIALLRPVDVMHRLRALGQPIRLFGETDEERSDRYRAVSSALPSESAVDNALLKAGQTWGQNETQLFDEKGKTRHETARAVVEGGGDGGGDGDGRANADDADEEELAPSFVATTPEQTISRHFKQLVKLWENELEQREPAEAASASGRMATAAFQQCKRHMKPFFKLLQTRSMPIDLVSTMVEITTFMQQREYVRAHDAYISCAIGNAPWPMGITGTGIHERQGRQHLRESKVAHVMNDETQRKYLQGVKRLMTFAQRVLPPNAPSKAVW
jgi:pre-mRNA-splicing factor 18